MMPVMMPAVGGSPEAMAIPMHSGSATRKTTTEASRSLPKTDDEPPGEVVDVVMKARFSVLAARRDRRKIRNAVSTAHFGSNYAEAR